uniref:sphingomyelin phosphodiesterase n=2 Tax=Gasterosteus aculeatus aculeatus TaxID=481459 RepID=A0AAQ4QIY6_GASAC|nr:sphingomyelin phosphodiesterase 2 isoform X1 [Gasterosteus aculeatus aculeatus]XP_040058893.1 sphingomyelin phosphodiesterase 2 isoform X1 [Gasterosteus aculeatus aculeatus]
MANTDSLRVRVFSLNCWGIRYVSKHTPQRYDMIGELLSKEEYDIVLLQEVWSEKDYLSLKKKLAFCHPHSHHFKSGVIGSGLAIFSKHRIHDTFLYRYSLNGYPYMVQHGDWFGGKAVGMAVLKLGGLTANVYVTHLHAEYSRDKDSYLPHRVVQAWELQQFVRHTSAAADVVILGGDLNMHPQDLGSRLLMSYTGLRDSYLESAEFDGCEDGMTLIADNPFIGKGSMGPLEKGIRIDYILFKVGEIRVPSCFNQEADVFTPPKAFPSSFFFVSFDSQGSSERDVHCDFMSTTKGSAPDHPFPYSDHEALTAALRVETRQRPSKNQDSAGGKTAELVDIVTEARTEVKVGLHCAERMRYTAARTGAMGLALLFLELAIAAVPWLALGAAQPFPRTSFYLLAALCVAILFTTALLYVFYSAELKSLQGAEDQMRLAVGSLQEELRGFPVAQPHGAQRGALGPEE